MLGWAGKGIWQDERQSFSTLVSYPELQMDGRGRRITSQKTSFFNICNAKKKKKSILTCTLQSWYLLDVPVQVLLASPLTDFLLNKEMMLRNEVRLSWKIIPTLPVFIGAPISNSIVF